MDWERFFLGNSDPEAGLGIEVSTSCACPFFASDYEIINALDDFIKPKRSEEFYKWRLDDLPHRKFLYCRASDENGKLLGFAIAELVGSLAKIVDWSVCCEERKDLILAKLLAPCATLVTRIRVSHLNPFSDEVDCFRSCGFSLMVDRQGDPVVNKLCIMSCDDDGIDPAFLDFSSWRLREIDRDHFLNCYISLS